MTQEFKFGDRVRNLESQEFVYIRPTMAGCLVVNITGAVKELRGEYFTLIPHPDTVRLERIGRLSVEAMGMKFDLDEYRRQIDETMQKEGHDE